MGAHEGQGERRGGTLGGPLGPAVCGGCGGRDAGGNAGVAASRPAARTVSSCPDRAGDAYGHGRRGRSLRVPTGMLVGLTGATPGRGRPPRGAQQRLIGRGRPAHDSAVGQPERAAVPRAHHAVGAVDAGQLAVAERPGVVAAAFDHDGHRAVGARDEYWHVADAGNQRLALGQRGVVAQVVPAFGDLTQERLGLVDPGGLAVAQVAADVGADAGRAQPGVRQPPPEVAVAGQPRRGNRRTGRARSCWRRHGRGRPGAAHATATPSR
jgi:hypothetical protein